MENTVWQATCSATIISKHFWRSLYFGLLADGLPESIQALRPTALTAVKLFNR